MLGGAFASTAEQFIQYPSNPDCYMNPPGPDCGGITTALPFYNVSPASQCNPQPSADSGITCTYTPAGDGSFSQNVQRLGLYAEDFWRVSHHLTVDYGLRYQTSFGLSYRGCAKRAGEWRAPILLAQSLVQQTESWQVHRSIINISSGSAEFPTAGMSLYCSTKAALNMFTSSIQLEQHRALTIYTVDPGMMDTEMQAVARRENGCPSHPIFEMPRKMEN